MGCAECEQRQAKLLTFANQRSGLLAFFAIGIVVALLWGHKILGLTAAT